MIDINTALLDGELGADGRLEKPETFDGLMAPLPVLGDPMPNNLAAHRWHVPILDEIEEADLIRRAQDGDKRAGAKLLLSFQRTILRLVGKRGIPRPKHKKGFWFIDDRYDDLVAAGFLAAWEAVENFDLTSGLRFGTYGVQCIAGKMANEARRLRKCGIKGDTRLQRYVFNHFDLTADQIVSKVKELKQPIYCKRCAQATRWSTGAAG
jgi:DNA-directed RNA polymerase specialized sigma24 family protein